MEAKPTTSKRRINPAKDKASKLKTSKRRKRGMSGFLKGKAKQLVPGDIFNLSK